MFLSISHQHRSFLTSNLQIISCGQDIVVEQKDILPSEHIMSRLMDGYLGRRMSRVSLALDSSRS
jgi:hypothetical protein